MIGEILKHQFKNNDAWVLSYREECFDQIGLKPSIKIPVYNGSLECEFRKYQIFEGKLSDFRGAGNILKTEEEKKAMAEKHRFKENRDFKKRLEEVEENEEGDIRTFKFHKFERDSRDSRDRDRRDFGRDRRDFDDRGRRDFGRGRRDFDDRGTHYDRRGGRDFRNNRDRKDFGKKGRRYDD